jgi:ATP-dependent exoDNAse (exonuclease V) beta subunit
MAERTPAADTALREKALDPRRSFIVQAPAGSGKTELLIQRLLVLLAHAEQPEEIAAITFTRKAAGEMRHRLLEALENAAGDSSENSGEGPTGHLQPGHLQLGHLQLQGRRARAVLERDREQGWNLLESPGRLRIQTIDSFCAALARQSPLGSGLGEHPGISGDPSALYQAAAQATLAGIETEGAEGEAVGRLLLHLDNHQPRVAGLLVAMLARRDQWLRHMEGAGNPTLSRGALEAELSALVSESLSETRASLQQALGLPHPGDGSQSGDAPEEAMALVRVAARQVA